MTVETVETPCGVQEVPLKVMVTRRGEVVEVRRRRLVNPGYEVVERLAAEFAKGSFQVQYVDDDGDVVTMSSQEEWEECLALWDGAGPLKLRVELEGRRWRGSGRAPSTDSGHGKHSCCKQTHHTPCANSSSDPYHHRRSGTAWWAHAIGKKRCAHQGEESGAQQREEWTRKMLRAATSRWWWPLEEAPSRPEKCMNCDYAVTKPAGLFCCRGCRFDAGHGRRCQRVAYEKEGDEAHPEGSEPSAQKVPDTVDEHEDATKNHEDNDQSQGHPRVMNLLEELLGVPRNHQKKEQETQEKDQDQDHQGSEPSAPRAPDTEEELNAEPLQDHQEQDQDQDDDEDKDQDQDDDEDKDQDQDDDEDKDQDQDREQTQDQPHEVTADPVQTAAPAAPPSPQYLAAVATLTDMGFPMTPFLLDAVKSCKGDVQVVMNTIL